MFGLVRQHLMRSSVRSPPRLVSVKTTCRMIFRQLFDSESSTYTYLLADTDTKEAVLIDPVIEKSERDAKLVGELGLSVKFVMNTHVHADHITGTGRLKVNTQFSNLKRNLKTKCFPETSAGLSVSLVCCQWRESGCSGEGRKESRQTEDKNINLTN